MSEAVTAEAPAFDAASHFIKMRGGANYLPVAARLVWFRLEHPAWGITTTVVSIDPEKQTAVFQATITDDAGRIIAQAHGSESVRDFGDYIEKAETKAVGRALAYCGYGTANAPELDDGRGGSTPEPPQNGNRGGYGNNRQPAYQGQNNGGFPRR